MIVYVLSDENQNEDSEILSTHSALIYAQQAAQKIHDDRGRVDELEWVESYGTDWIAPQFKEGGIYVYHIERFES